MSVEIPGLRSGDTYNEPRDEADHLAWSVFVCVAMADSKLPVGSFPL